MKTRVVVYVVFLLSITAWCALIFAAPYLKHNNHTDAAELLYIIFSETCHQKPERSFFMWGEKLGVCARCSGIYFGMLLATLVYPIIMSINNTKTPHKKWLIVSLIPLGVDGVTQALGLRESVNLLRVATGLVFGFVLPFYLIPVFSDIAEAVLSEIKC